MSDDNLKFILEAVLFASEKPLSTEELREAFEESISVKEINEALEILKTDYQSQGRGFQLVEIAGGFQIVTDPRFAGYLKRFYQEREKKKLSQATLETLSIIAYRQPVTRADMEFIRGVNVDGALKTLVEKDLVKIVGRKEVPGRPMLYGTTDRFLEHFGLKTAATYGNNSAPIMLNQDKLKELNLPCYDYDFVLKRVVDEIKKYFGQNI